MNKVQEKYYTELVEAAFNEPTACRQIIDRLCKELDFSQSMYILIKVISKKLKEKEDDTDN